MAETSTKGTAWLAEYVSDQTGKEVDGYKVRILLRSLAKEGVLEREEGRYTFTGPKDPQVIAVLKAVKQGKLEKAQAEKVDELKSRRTRKSTAPVEEDEEEAPRSRRTRKAAAPAAKKAAPSRRRRAAEVEEDEDLDIDEI